MATLAEAVVPGSPVVTLDIVTAILVPTKSIMSEVSAFLERGTEPEVSTTSKRSLTPS